MIPYILDSSVTMQEAYLSDTISCIIHEERNGAYTLALQYPVNGADWEGLQPGVIIAARVNDDEYIDYFRVFSVEKTSDGLMTVRANQVGYDLAYSYRTKQTYTGTAASILQSLLIPENWNWASDISETGTIEVLDPVSVRSIIMGGEGSLIDVFGGELEWFRYILNLHSSRGEDRGVVLSYGENITRLVYEDSEEEYFDGIYGFATYEVNSTTQYKTSTAMFSGASGNKLKLMDFTDAIPVTNQGSSTQSNLDTKVSRYASKHNMAHNRQSFTVEVIPRWYQAEYADERLALCDTVTINFSPFGIEKKAKVVATDYDVLQERYTRITVGEMFPDILDTMLGADQSASVVKADTSKYPAQWKSDISAAVAPLQTLGERVHDDTSVSLSSGTTLQNIASFSLTKGTWMVSISVRFAANATGRRAINLANTSGGSALNLRWGNGATAVNGAYTYLHLASSVVITGSQQTYFINAYQNSGGALTTEVGWDCIRIT